MNNGENWSAETYRAAERAIGYEFRDRELLITCFTHKSYANAFGGEHNERLEFLGDAVLGLVVSDMLYRDHLKSDEGELTNRRKQYVSKDALTPIAEKLALMQYLRLSGGKENLGAKTPSSLFEAVVAGIYLDGGLKEAEKFLSRHLEIAAVIDYKTALQEYVQARSKRAPEYFDERETETGFVCGVRALGKTAEGEGTSKKAAQVSAAKQLLEKLQK